MSVKNKMKRIGLFAAGSTGDVYPVISLGKFLSYENDVTMVVHQNFYEMVEKCNLKFMKLGNNIYESLTKDNEIDKNEKTQNVNYGKIFSTIKEIYKNIDENDNLLNFDLVIISGLTMFIYPDLEKKKIPYIVLHTVLDATSSNLFSSPMFGLNALGWETFYSKIFLRFTWFIYNTSINYFIYKITCERFKELKINYKNYRNDNNVPKIYTFSKYLIDIGNNENILQVGYLNFPYQFNNRLPDTLEIFLNESNFKYIYIGFGSMMETLEYKNKIEDLAIETIKYINNKYNQKVKIILHVPKKYIIDNNIEINELYILKDKICNIELFKRCDVIVHHGGVGTCHAAIISNKYSIIVPHVFDQFFNGTLLEYYNLGTNLKNIKEINYTILGDAINNVFNLKININEKCNIIRKESEETEKKIVNFCNKYIK